MLIDFHVHAFPDRLAKRAMEGLLSNYEEGKQTHTNGTIANLLSAMEHDGVDISVVLPIATKPEQTKALCSWAANIASEQIIPLGSINPHSDNYRRDIDLVVSYGLKGIKLHAQYQDFIVNAPEMLKIYDYAFNNGLFILQHSGFDIAYKPPFKSTPAMFADVARLLKGGVMIAAHLGGMLMWDEVLDRLCGSNIYLDCSMGSEHYSKEQFCNIVKAHGADKILFASDNPWGNPKKEYNAIKSCGLSQQEQDFIFYKNAKRLLGL